MGGCRCSYKSCRSATKSTENLHFFHYPVKHRERCAIWIKNADKPQFADLPDYQLRNKVICGLHFEDKFFANMEKRRLVHNAIPTLDAGCDSTSDDLSYIKEVEVVPSGTDGSTYRLHSQHLQLQPGPSIRRDRVSVRNGKFVIEDVSGDEQPEVYTIDPSFFNQSMFSNKSITDVVISAKSSLTDDGITLKQDPIDNDENCMMIYDTAERNTGEVLTDTANMQHLFYGSEQTEEEGETMDEEEDTKRMHLVVLENTQGDLFDENDENTTASSLDSNGSDRSPSPAIVAKQPAAVKRGAAPAKAVSVPPLRLTNKCLLRSMKGRVPDSLLGAISLHLQQRRNVITKEEEAYAKIIRAMPPMGNVVLKKHGWFMPI